MILVIDNYDSFVYNLARYMTLAGWECKIARNDKITVGEIRDMKPQAIIMSPGPGTPDKAGICVEAIKEFGSHIPMLGVCLGHQCIGEAYGIRTIRAVKAVHGKATAMHHTDDPLFAGVPETFRAGRYHSLMLAPGNIAPLISIATGHDGEIMAVKHETHPVYGVQFHPESVLTEHGMKIIENFTAIALAFHSTKAAA